MREHPILGVVALIKNERQKLLATVVLPSGWGRRAAVSTVSVVLMVRPYSGHLHSVESR